MEEIVVHRYKDMELEGASIIINGFPTRGLVSTIVANYLIGSLNLDQIGALDSESFPPISMIYASKPKFPARIYADEASKVVVFLSEFTPTTGMARPIANTMLKWARDHGCRRIIAPEVVMVEDDSDGLEIFGIGSTDRARADMEKLDVRPFIHGMMSGISAVALNEGKRAGYDVIALVAQARSSIPDARAAAKIIEIITHPGLDVDVGPLYKEAEEIEAFLKDMREQAESMSVHDESPGAMYR
ncbi:MAG: proteasome assembly chaperone family protein [Euryarchaeota archaeon]|nr:proteasome assembly chaperone family protein [Euryarchaeota archaeon]